MQKQIYVNLPVKDLAASTAFYEGLGFVKNPMFSNEDASALSWSETIMVMLLKHEFYGQFYPEKQIADSHAVSEVGLCISMESAEAVDMFAAKAAGMGGKVYTVAINEANDFMHTKTVEDLDGHAWEPMWMDVSKFPGAQ